MRTIKLKWLGKLGIAGVTIFPIGVLVDATLSPHSISYLMVHEGVHWKQQERWFKKAWFFGLIAWYVCYLFFLPWIWNPFRRKWETEAFEAQGIRPERINSILRRWPYWLLK